MSSPVLTYTAQVGAFLAIHIVSCSVLYIFVLMYFICHLLSQSLIIYFSLQVRNKPHDEGANIYVNS